MRFANEFASKEDIATLADSDPEISKNLSPLGPGDLLDPTNHLLARQKASAFELAVLQALGPAEPDLIESEQQIPIRDGHLLPIRITKPTHAPAEGSPLIICFHGGGFISGTIYNVAPYARGLSKLFGAVVVAPTYRLAPECKFPTGVNDAWDAVRWIAAHAESLSATPSRGLILSGGSAGANFVCVLAEQAKTEELEPKITGLWSCMPVLFTEDQASIDTLPERYKHLWFSREQVQSTPILHNSSARTLLDYYTPDVLSPLWSPFNAKNAFEDLPPAYIQVCGRDIIRDDGLMYERVLRDCGVQTRLDVYRGLPHCFWAAIPTQEVSRGFMVDIARGMGWLLGREVDLEEAGRVMVFPEVDEV